MYWNSEISPDREPHRVTLIRGEWVDTTRHNRTVPYKVYVPETGTNTPMPVIIWSHGLGGSRDGAGFISRFVAAHGYIIVHIQHHGTDTSLWEGKPGHPWDNIRAARIPRKHVLQRYRDVPFALRCLHDGQVPNVDPHLFDLSRLGMSGHSFGAMTTQVMAGQRIARGRRHYDLFQPEFRAGILYSPVPGRKDHADPDLVYSGIRIPLLHITGTDDESPVEGFGYQRRLNVYNHAVHPDQHLVIIRNGDHMVFNGSRGQLADNPDRPRHEEILKIISLAWWDAHLKGNQAAQHWLSAHGITGFFGADATYHHKSSTPQIPTG